MAQTIVLVADSSPHAARQLTEVLSEAGAKVIVSTTQAEARGILLESPVDLLFTEIQLVDGAGVTLIAEAHSKSIPSVVLGAKISTEELAEAMRHGVADVVFKPLTYHSILASFHRALRNYREQGSIASAPPAPHFSLAAPSSSDLGVTVPLCGNYDEVQRKLIQATIQRFAGNKTAAAKALGLHRRRLYRLLGR